MTRNEIQEIENQVLSVLRQHADPAIQNEVDVVNMLTAAGLPEDIVRAVVWRLLANGELELTPQLDIVAISPPGSLAAVPVTLPLDALFDAADAASESDEDEDSWMYEPISE